MSTVGGNRYGWFVIEEIPDLAIDNSLRTGLCHQADGDGDVEENDSRRGHAHFHDNSCESRDGNDVEANDDESNTHFQSTSVDAATYSYDENAEAVTLVGTGVDNGLPVGFTMIAVDNKGLALGVVNLVLTDGHTLTGSLANGTLMIQ